MESLKISAFLLICMVFITLVNPIFGCGHCSKPPHHKIKPRPPPKKGPVTHPPIVNPPVVTLPPILNPPVTLPPVTGNPPSAGGKPSCPPPPPPPSQEKKCPIDSLKLGACVDLLGGLVHIGLGDPVVNECCPVLQGLVELEAAVCLCTTLRLKLLNLNIFVPIALQLLLTCGKTPPPGYTCTL
ncbi:pEARLI1-like lipid transfer protein [Thalictrum thalictroides]|uniref:PEARLI1-like lipid transfer protein n=1 Tax=Thalictrum thalictroides TaxID=46969 RepID=A0A7J6USB8_THATH|nr:pEARLI1-like lipid transfer protein [Thalictrum thalictroides]